VNVEVWTNLPAVARSRITYDRETKGWLYAAMGVAEYRMVDVAARSIEVRRDPQGERFTSVERFGPGQSTSIAAFPDVTIDVAAVLA